MIRHRIKSDSDLKNSTKNLGVISFMRVTCSVFNRHKSRFTVCFIN